MTERVAVALTALCGVASLTFMMMVGRHQKSLLLMAMFTVWVASPFLGLLYGLMANIPWRPQRPVRLGVVACVISLASAGVYGEVALGPATYKPASFFLIMPAISWVLVGVFALAARSSERKRARNE